MSQPVPPPSAPPTQLGGCLVRITWMLVGNLAGFLAAIQIAKGTGRSLSAADAALGIIVAVMLLARYIDIARFNGQTATGQSAATMRHWRRYALLLPLTWLAFWGMAHWAARTWH